MLWKYYVLIAVYISSEFATADKYTVPEAHVEALEPKGFRICVPNEDGIELFAFHGSINKDLPDLAAGDYAKDILRSVNGAWCFVDSDKRLKKGDIINYWTYVQLNRLGYRRDAQRFVVKNFTPANTPIGSFLPLSTTSLPPAPPLHSNPQSPVNDFHPANACGTLVDGLSNTINELQTQVEKLNQANSQVVQELQILGMKNSKKALVLSATHSDSRDPISVLVEFITHKLNIPVAEYTILRAFRLSDGRIIFELKTKSERNQILSRWRSKQKNLRDVRLNDIQTVMNTFGATEHENQKDSDEDLVPSIDVRNGESNDEDQTHSLST